MYRPREPEKQRHAQTEGEPSVGARPRSLLDRALPGNTGTYPSNAATVDIAPAVERYAPRPETVARAAQKDPLEARIQNAIDSLSTIGIADILRWLGGGLRIILVTMVAGIVLAFAYALVASPRYTAQTELVVDPSNLNVVADDLFSSSQQRDSQLLEVESKLRILTSSNVLRQVIKDLDLTNDPDFVRPGLLAPLTHLFSGNAAAAGDKEQAVLEALSKSVTATREATSFVVVLSVWSRNPEKSVRLSQAIVKAFGEELFKGNSDSAGRLATSINNRLDELRSSVTKAEEKVEQFRRKNGLQQSAGELSSSRISSALDTQVLDAQQRLIQAEARYNQMRSAVAGRRIATDTVFDSPAMTTLRTSYTVLEQQMGALALTYGARHPRLISLQSEKAALDKAISDEASRILETAKTEADQARASLTALRGKASDERATVFTDNDAQVQLRELERDARAKAAVYETYLSRTHQITERQQINASNVRVISEPLPPKVKSWPPRTPLLMIGGALAGVILGVIFSLLSGLWGHVRTSSLREA